MKVYLFGEKSGYYVLKIQSRSHWRSLKKTILNFRLKICVSVLINRLPVHDLKLTKEEQASGMDELIQALMPILEEYGVYATKGTIGHNDWNATSALYFIAKSNSGEKVLLEQTNLCKDE